MFEYFEHDYPTANKDIPDGVPFQYHRVKLIREGLPYPYKILDLVDYQRKYVCVRTDVYPLIWIWWAFVNGLKWYNYLAKGKTYWFLRNCLNHGKDFVPDTEFCGGWKRIFKHFLTYKFTR